MNHVIGTSPLRYAIFLIYLVVLIVVHYHFLDHIQKEVLVV